MDIRSGQPGHRSEQLLGLCIRVINDEEKGGGSVRARNK